MNSMFQRWLNLWRSRQRLRQADWLNHRYNFFVTARDADGRVVYTHKSHNILLNGGREWMFQHMSYSHAGVSDYPVTVGAVPPGPVTDDARLAWMGVGVGGREQVNQNLADDFYADGFTGYIVRHGAPTFTQDDTDVTKTGLEAPVLWTDAPSNKYGKPIINVEYSSPPIVWVRYTVLYELGDITDVYGWPAPISEAALYPLSLTGGLVDEPDRTYMTTHAIAYEAFPTITKTFAPAVQLEIQWMLKA